MSSLFDKFARAGRPRRTDDEVRRTPPGQTLTNGFPVLTYGAVPSVAPPSWTCRVFGAVECEAVVTWDDLMAMPQTPIVCDIHCVTTWSKLDSRWTGVRTRDFLAAIADRIGGVRPEATHVMQHCYGGYTTNTSLEDFLGDDVFFAHTYDGAPLHAEHGGPVRIVLPKLYFWKSAKWINGIELMTRDRRGFWEVNGYHNHADPWQDERFSSQE